MDPSELTRFPPILQLVGVGLLGLYVLVSLLGRVSPRFEWLWRDAEEERGALHWLQYTIVPALLLAGAMWAVIANWNPQAPLTGGWSARELALGPGLALVGVVLVVAASAAQRARESAVRPAPAWIPAVMMLLGLAALVFGVLTLGRTVKKLEAKDGSPSPLPTVSAPDEQGIPANGQR